MERKPERKRCFRKAPARPRARGHRARDGARSGIYDPGVGGRFLQVSSTTYSLERSRQDLHDLHTSAPLRPHILQNFVQNFA